VRIFVEADAMWDSTRQHLRDAWRGLRKTAGASAAIIILLALGIGANATMFRIVDRVLLSPPRFLTDPDRLRFVYAQRPTLTMFPKNLTYSDIDDLKHLPAFDAVSAYTDPVRATLGTGAEARKVRVQRAEANYFPMLGVRPLLGRFYSAAEDEPDPPTLTAVISERFWVSEFGRDPQILGRVLALDKGKYQIVGVMPAGFTGVGLNVIDVWLPLRAATVVESNRSALTTRTWWWAHAVARLKPGATDAEAGAQMTVAHINARRAAEQAGSEPYLTKGAPPRLYTTSIIAARGPNPSLQASIAVWLAGVSAIVLLIACANVANLLLTRGIQARRELAVRVALGAARGRLVVQVLTEAALLAIAGAVVALMLARVTGTVTQSFLPDIDFSDSGIGPRLLLFNAIAAALTVLLAGVLPAIQASRTSAAEALRAVSRGSSARRSPLRTTLMIGQTMLSVVLLIGAGLFVRSLAAAGSTDVGFDYKHLIVATIEQNTGLTSARRDQLYLDALPRLAGHDVIDDLPDGGPFLYSGTTGFFETLGVAITRGRAFEPQEYVDGAEPVGMVSETFVRTVWPHTDPLTQCFQIHANAASRATAAANPNTPPEPCRRVVGVFHDFARLGIADKGAIAIAIPRAPGQRRAVQGIVVRANDPIDLVPAIRQTILGLSGRAIRPAGRDVDPLRRTAPAVAPGRDDVRDLRRNRAAGRGGGALQPAGLRRRATDARAGHPRRPRRQPRRPDVDGPPGRDRLHRHRPRAGDHHRQDRRPLPGEPAVRRQGRRCVGVRSGRRDVDDRRNAGRHPARAAGDVDQPDGRARQRVIIPRGA
jgi:putative ABC transport system permease protein